MKIESFDGWLNQFLNNPQQLRMLLADSPEFKALCVSQYHQFLDQVQAEVVTARQDAAQYFSESFKDLAAQQEETSLDVGAYLAGRERARAERLKLREKACAEVVSGKDLGDNYDEVMKLGYNSQYFYTTYHTPDGVILASSDSEAMRILKEKFGEYLTGVIAVSTYRDDGSYSTVWME